MTHHTLDRVGDRRVVVGLDGPTDLKPDEEREDDPRTYQVSPAPGGAAKIPDSRT
ncbi:MAG: hypothetical protein RQ745_00140 [Longimicrobiales bacterium]|nr:hypothetical protein [Longimicrobiales bacterium]